MSGHQNSGISIMNFGEQLLGQDEKQLQMNNTWVPITPEKLILIRSNPISDWPVNQVRRPNFQEFPVRGSDYMKEILPHYSGPDQNLHLRGQTGRTREHNNFECNSADRNRVLNQIASTYTPARHYQSSGLNSNTLELLLKKNATNITSANRNLNLNINMAARNPLLPKSHPQASRDMRESNAGVPRCNIHSASDIVYQDANRLLIPNWDSDFNGSNSNSLLNGDIHCSVSNQLKGIFSEIPHGVPRCNIHSASDIVYQDANRLLIPNWNSDFNGSNSNSLLNGDIHCSVSNQQKGIFSEIPHGDSYPKYNLNYEPLTEADSTTSFINSLQSIPEAIDQLKFVDNQFCTILDDTIAESRSQENKQEDLVSSTDNEIQEYYDGLLQQIVDSSSAAISTPYGDQQGSDSNICVKGSDLAFDLNKTPEQKAPKRRKHRPKVIVESKPKRSPNPATQKTPVKEKRPRKRKNIPKTAETPQAEVIKETSDSTVASRKSCRKALNFDLENTRYESQSRIVCQQDINHRNVKDFDTASDCRGTEMLSGADIRCGTNSALPISHLNELAVENQQPRNTDDTTLLLNQKPSNTFLSKRNPTISLSATTEEQQIAKFLVNEKGPAQGNFDLCEERNNGCMQQNIHTKEIGNISPQSETCFENCQKTRELICQNTLQLEPNIPSKSIKRKGSKRKYCNSTANQDDSATNPLGTSLCQEILQGDETLAKGFSETRKRKKNQNRRHAKARGRSSCQMMSKDDSQKVRIKDKNGSQSESFEEMSNYCTEANRYEEHQNNVAKTGDCFAISGEPHWIYSTLIDEIICQLNGLNLWESRESNITEMEGQKALVPYNGDGSIVPYQDSEFAKKRKPRPKVDLDPETERTWKLLMGKEGSEDLEGTDKEKEKWWEEERNVFRGRVDSFIARMHLVQGDRRFSKWKGSVVDSVTGVFLTQNVSDHLSSSAFMSLAARFPHKSNSSKRSYDVVGTNKSVGEPVPCIVNPDDTIMSYGQGTLSKSNYYLGFETPHHTRELWRDSETSSIKGNLIKPNNPSSEEEFLASQDSLDSSITQGTRGNRSCSGSNSESEGPNSRFEPIKTQLLTSANSLQIGKTTMFQEFYNSVNGVSLFEERSKDGQMQQAEHVKQGSRVSRNSSHNFCSAFSHPSNCGYPQKQGPVVFSTEYELHYPETQGLETFQMNDEQYSWAEAVSVHSKFSDTNHKKFGIREVGDSADKPTEKQYRTLASPELPTMNSYGPLNEHLIILQGTPQSRSHASYNQPSPNHHLVGEKTLQPEGSPFTESLNTSQILGRGCDDIANKCCNIPKHVENFDSENRQMCSESDNNSVEPKPQKQDYSLGPTNKESKFKVSKTRKAKSEKKHPDNWDKLRMEVQANGTTKERSKDTMDSLDYEALRCASVKEISDTIKERGMNNMLAERIKDFLNRLVKDHGSIDLEWLRYVPPDKAKDYLLSIRGLGLKSVECVRLLTLHHLAFPVDTNVGRIAVRLGWVPLQPLPESLQLHLLELYPVLESIQKYLWPRLCKLDQRTLYELHYQMITFGKVFCTKNKPNCNACPMRAECRHFASAFASARLALPGPEEKRIVSMPVPIAAERNPFVGLNPVILPLPENNLINEASPESGKCEPIIEEPATPENEGTEALESDIEDFFGEDPDEIPTIDVNIQELAMNVQNYMQEYKEHHEVDMSKALVALTPQSASIHPYL